MCEFLLLSIRTIGRLFRTKEWTFVFHKIRGIYQLAEQLLLSQELLPLT
jgi:chromosomal replication initiation ATPase DnaA